MCDTWCKLTGDNTSVYRDGKSVEEANTPRLGDTKFPVY